jgi:hypothetical protein
MDIKKPLVAVTGAALLGIGGLVALPGAAMAAPVPAATASSHVYGVWPGQANGQPKDLKAGSPKGFYLWHSSKGWHLEVTHPGKSHVVFAGTISTDGALSYQRIKDEPRDVTKLGPHGHVLSFAFSNYGFLDGVHFETAKATKLVFHLTIDGHKAGVEAVEIGAKSLHPDKVPFTIDRTGIR